MTFTVKVRAEDAGNLPLILDLPVVASTSTADGERHTLISIDSEEHFKRWLDHFKESKVKYEIV